MDTAVPSRICPTASERCHRRDESSSTIIPETEDNPQIEEGEGDEESEELMRHIRVVRLTLIAAKF